MSKAAQQTTNTEKPQNANSSAVLPAIERRVEFVVFVVIEKGNPNGDPDFDNNPRQDPVTNFGLMTDAAIKRRIRNFIQDYISRYFPELLQTCGIYYQSGAILEELNKQAEQSKQNDREEVQDVLCRMYWDVRTFGATAATKKASGGSITGPVQLGISWSADPIEVMPLTITRVCKTSLEKKRKGGEESQADNNDEAHNRTMGKKYMVPFAVYRIEGSVSPWYAKKTGFTEQDLNLFFLGLVGCWDHCVSASSGQRSICGLHVFQHSNYLGSAPRSELFKRVKVQRKEGVELVRSLDDYEFSVDLENMPKGVRYLPGFLEKVWDMLGSVGVEAA